MKRIINFPLEAGGSVAIETEDRIDPGGVMRGGPSPSLLEKSIGSFEAAIAAVQPAVFGMAQQFAASAQGVKLMKVKFGLKFSAEAGAIIASVGSEANFEIELSWNHSNRTEKE